MEYDSDYHRVMYMCAGKMRNRYLFFSYFLTLQRNNVPKNQLLLLLREKGKRRQPFDYIHHLRSVHRRRHNDDAAAAAAGQDGKYDRVAGVAIAIFVAGAVRNLLLDLVAVGR